MEYNRVYRAQKNEFRAKKKFDEPTKKINQLTEIYGTAWEGIFFVYIRC
jgi:hypothetical protein